ncbi:MAG: hypothetical protein ABFD92_18525 [Planctomycetaceae bacterium]|nr:DUF6259 domain-containing protein [Planctomycetaceae bacterium]
MKTYLKEQRGRMRLGNGKVELVIDRASGYFIEILNRKTGLSHKLPGTGSWPFELTLGHDWCPDFLRVSMPVGGKGMQAMRYTIMGARGGKTLRMTYANLVTVAGNRTGVRLAVRITLADDAEHFLIRACLTNGSPYRVTKLACGGGELVAAASRDAETLAVPTWSYGQVWPNPHGHFTQPATFGYPLFGTHCGLDCGWMDLYGPAGGIGVGYLNRQGMTMLFNVQQAGGGMHVNWQMFNLAEHPLRFGSVGCVCGLESGASFETDAWIVAPHEGDWHRMADIYRREYEQAFRGDYRTWVQTSPAVRKMDFFVTSALDKKTFADVPQGIRRYAKEIGLLPENMGLLLWGSGANFPNFMPDHLPCKKSLGGDAGAAAMCSELRGMGMTGICFYAHLFYNHPKARDYVAQADTGCDTQNANWLEIGNVACPDCKAWQKLWVEKYAAGYAALGGGGVTLDQGPTQYLVCPRDDHPHGSDSVKRLCAHVNGIDRMIREIRETFGPDGGMVTTEVGSDIQTRNADLWQSAGMGFYSPGGLPRREIVRYSVPYRPAILGEDIARLLAPELVNEALINGFVAYLGVQMLTETSIDGRGRGPLQRALRQFAKLRRAMRDGRAPGYPEGFRDREGLKISNAAIAARSYRGAKGITVVYCAGKAAKGTITVDPSALGFPHLPRRIIRLDLAAGEGGYEALGCDGKG